MYYIYDYENNLYVDIYDDEVYFVQQMNLASSYNSISAAKKDITSYNIKDVEVVDQSRLPC